MREAQRLADADNGGPGGPIVGTLGEPHARLAVGAMVEAARLLSPRVADLLAEASGRAFADAHHRVAARHADGDGDRRGESEHASGAPERTGERVVYVPARRADEDGLHPEEGSAGPCMCDAPAHSEVRVDIRTMRAVEDSRLVCNRCGRASASRTVQ